MNAKAHEALSALYDYIDHDCVVVLRPKKRVIQDYAKMFYDYGYQQGKKDTYKVASEMIKEIK